jgi:hypothetical protein
MPLFNANNFSFRKKLYFYINNKLGVKNILAYIYIYIYINNNKCNASKINYV